MLERHRPVAYALLLACALLLKMAYLHRLSMETVPGWGDAVDYDCLGIFLSRGEGFRLDFGDPEFQRPYRNSGFSKNFEPYYALSARGLTMFRPPLFPLLVATNYAAFGRRFTPVRVTQFLLTAAALALVFFLLWGESPRAGAAYAVIALLEPTLARHAVQVLTEPLASALLCAWFYCECRKNRFSAAGSGFFSGLLILTRPIYAIGLTVSLVENAVRKNFKAAAWTAGVAAVTCSPWAVRNCLLSGRFAPFGTHGTIMMAHAYSDQSYRDGIIDFRKTPLVFMEPNPAGPDHLIAAELTVADAKGREFRNWIGQNFWKVPRLVFARIIENYTPSNPGEAIILILTFLGLASTRHSPLARRASWFMLYSTAGVALMWAHGNRFNYPVLPVQYLVAAYGLKTLMSFLMRRTWSGPNGAGGTSAA